MWLLYPFAIPPYSAQFRFGVVFRSECLPVVQGSGLCLLVYTPVYTKIKRNTGTGGVALQPKLSQARVYSVSMTGKKRRAHSSQDGVNRVTENNIGRELPGSCSVRGLATYGYRVSRLRNQILTSWLLAIIYLQGPTFLPPSCSPTRRLRLGIMVSVFSVTVY